FQERPTHAHEEGRPKEALPLLQQALEMLGKVPQPLAGDLFLKACALAQRCAVVGIVDGDLTDKQKAERQRYAEAAVEALRQSIAKGYPDLKALQTSFLLDPLRRRDDFRQLVAQVKQK